jgi:hypothetical protein
MAKYKPQKTNCFRVARIGHEGENIDLFALKAKKITIEKWLLNFYSRKTFFIHNCSQTHQFVTIWLARREKSCKSLQTENRMQDNFDELMSLRIIVNSEL